MSSTASFDPYRDWLGIEPHEQPADHYRLLGLARFETDLKKIAEVADQQMGMVRSFQTGPRGASTQKLLNELAAARVCLLNPDTKREYDEQLARRLMEFEAQRRATRAMPLSPPPPAEDRLTLPVDSSISRRPSWQPIVLGGAALLAIALAGGGWAVSGWLAQQAHRREQTPSSPVTTKKPKAEADAKSQPPIVQSQGDRPVELPLAAAVLSGALVLETQNSEAVIAQWGSPDDESLWRFRVPRPGFFAVELIYSTASDAGELEVELRIDDRARTCALRASGDVRQFLEDSYTVVVPQSGTHRLAIRPRKLTRSGGLRLKTVRLIPVETDARPPGSGEK